MLILRGRRRISRPPTSMRTRTRRSKPSNRAAPRPTQPKLLHDITSCHDKSSGAPPHLHSYQLTWIQRSRFTSGSPALLTLVLVRMAAARHVHNITLVFLALSQAPNEGNQGKSVIRTPQPPVTVPLQHVWILHVSVTADNTHVLIDSTSTQKAPQHMYSRQQSSTQHTITGRHHLNSSQFLTTCVKTAPHHTYT